MTAALSQFVAEAPNAMAMFDRDMRYVAASRAWRAAHGHDVSPVGRLHYDDFPDFPEGRKAAHRRSLDGAVETAEELAFVDAEGRGRWVRWQVRPWRDRDGAIGGIVIDGEDISDRVEAQRAAEDMARRAKDAERCLTEALDAIPGGFAVYDADDRLLVLNRAMRAIYGFAEDSNLRGLRFEDLLRDAMARGVYGVAERHRERWVRERLDLHRNPHAPGEYRHADGRWMRGEDRRTPDGGSVVTRIDITDLKNRQWELAQKNAFLEATLTNIAEGIAVFGPDRRLLMANSDRVAGLLEAPPDLVRPGAALDDLLRLRAERGDYGGLGFDAIVEARDAAFGKGQALTMRGQLPDGRTMETRVQAMPDGGVVLVFSDVTALADREAKLAGVQRDMVVRQEAERRRIARELHDSLGQYLAAINMRIGVLVQTAAAGGPVIPGLAELKGLTATVASEVSRLAWELRPIVLDDLGLEPALRRLADEWERRSELRFDLHLELGRRLPEAVETILYRALQEAITNIVKHARAATVGVILKTSPQDVVAVIEDDGIGFDPEQVGRGPAPRLGLLGMKERLATIGGTVEIESRPGQGTTLIVRAPLECPAGA